jgi:hypothetical protein
MIGDIKHDDDAISAPKVTACDIFESVLSGGVPLYELCVTICILTIKPSIYAFFIFCISR